MYVPQNKLFLDIFRSNPVKIREGGVSNLPMTISPPPALVIRFLDNQSIR
jgi:hypothetical protein